MSLRPSTRAELRKKIYKTGVDADEARRRREDNLVEIRKNKREDSLLKKRREGMMLQQQQPLGAGLDGPQSAAAFEKREVLANDKAQSSNHVNDEVDLDELMDVCSVSAGTNRTSPVEISSAEASVDILPSP